MHPDHDKPFCVVVSYLTRRLIPSPRPPRCAGDSSVGEGPRGALRQQRARPSRQFVFCLTHHRFVFDWMSSRLFTLVHVLSCVLASFHMQIAIHRLQPNQGILKWIHIRDAHQSRLLSHSDMCPSSDLYRNLTTMDVCMLSVEHQCL